MSDSNHSRWFLRQLICTAGVIWAITSVATATLAQTIVPQTMPAGYLPQQAPQCGPALQSVNLDLSTTTVSGADPRWIVNGGQFNSTAPYHATLSAWTVLPTSWIQPGPPGNNGIATGFGAGPYVFTIWFNLPCSPESYNNLQLSGTFASDNQSIAYLNGAQVGACPNSSCFGASQPAQMFALSGFHQGLNSLSIVVVEGGGSPTGTAVLATVTGTCAGATCVRQTTGTLKICKVAGAGIAAGTPFNFTIGSSTLTIPAGPAPGGTCVVGPTLPVGTNVTVTEVVPLGAIVTGIVVSPPSQQVGAANLPAGSVNVTIGAGVTEVTYTDQRAGFLEICKNGDVQGNFSFTVNPGALGPINVPAGSCSPAIQVAAGAVQIHETPASGTAISACNTIPATQQGVCNLNAQISTVTVTPGDISAMTIAFITNRTVPCLNCNDPTRLPGPQPSTNR